MSEKGVTTATGGDSNELTTGLEKYVELTLSTPEVGIEKSIDSKSKSRSKEIKVVHNDNVHEIIIWLFVNSIDDIKLADETFYADFDLILLWEARMDNKYNTFTAENLDLEDSSLKFFNENMVILNGFDIKIEFLRQGYMPNGGCDWYGTELEPVAHPNEENGGEYLPTIFLKYSVKGLFKERFELYNFPMDIQDVTIHLASSKHKSKLLIGAKLDPDIFFFPWPSAIDQNINLDEYSIEAFHIVNYFSSYEYANIKCQVKLARKYSVYFWKVGVYMLLLGLGGVGVFCTSGSDISISDQLSLLFTLLLTGVAVQFVVSTWLPMLSYVTLLDKYVISSFLTIFSIIVLLFIVDVLDIDLEEHSQLKWYAIYINLGIFLFIQILWCFIFQRKRQAEWKKVHRPTAGVENDDDDIKTGNNDLIDEDKANAVITVAR